MAVPSAQARLTIKVAFERFKRSVTAEDARKFQDTNLSDVWDTAADVEDKLANCKSLRNMRRIEPFLRGLGHYASVVEVLCNGTPYLPWIWAPIKLMLQLSSDYLSSFEKLLKAYEMICDNMPRFEQFGVAFQEDSNFQQVLALFYADILEFHRRAYKFFRANAWTRFFHTSWGRFDGRFKTILESIARDSELIDNNAKANDIIQAKQLRDKQNEYITQQEKQEEAEELASVITWLQINRVHDQEEELDHLTSRCHPGSCDWIFQLEKMAMWMRDGEPQSLIWLHGKPGAGKSVICSSVIKSLQEKDPLILYFFCTYRSLDSSQPVHILRSLAAQILRKIPNCAAYVYHNYLGRGETPSIGNLRKLLPHLLSAAPLARIVLDGLDECAIGDQEKIIDHLLALNKDTLNCRVLISSREVPKISLRLSQKVKISLSEENKSINVAIEYFIKKKLADIRLLQEQNEMIESLRKIMNEKAEGMFLWVQLVLNSMEETYNLHDLKCVIETLPKDLTDLYSRILSAIKRRWKEKNPRNFDKGVRILQWILHSKRPVSKGELIDAIALGQENFVINEFTKFREDFLETCKPLVEEGPNDTLVLIHFSLKEYLGQPDCELPTSERESHRSITLACVATLTSGLDLLDPAYGKDQSLVKTGKRFLTLLPYAHSFWTYHLYRLVQLDSSLSEDKAAYVIGCLNDFNRKHRSILQHFPRVAHCQLSDKMLQANTFQGLDRNFRFYDLVSKAIIFRQKLQDDPCDTGPDSEQFGLNYDPTLLSQLMYNFKQIVQQLLSADFIPGLSDESLAAFKRLHGSVSFLCRFSSCPSASRGFATSEKRDEHERSMHGRFHCTNTTCQYRKIGFRTSKQLKEHLSRYHPVSEGPRVPDSILDTNTTKSSADIRKVRTRDTPTNETHGDSLRGERARITMNPDHSPPYLENNGNFDHENLSPPLSPQQDNSMVQEATNLHTLTVFDKNDLTKPASNLFEDYSSSSLPAYAKNRIRRSRSRKAIGSETPSLDQKQPVLPPMNEEDSIKKPLAYPPNIPPPSPIQTYPLSVPGTPPNPHSPSALSKSEKRPRIDTPVYSSQHQSKNPGSAPATIPSRTNYVESLSRPPSNLGRPSPIDARPRQLAVSGPPEGPRQQQLANQPESDSADGALLHRQDLTSDRAGPQFDTQDSNINSQDPLLRAIAGVNFQPLSAHLRTSGAGNRGSSTTLNLDYLPIKKSAPVNPPVNPPVNSPVNSPVNPPVNPEADLSRSSPKPSLALD